MSTGLKQNFYELSPHIVLDGIESVGFRTTGEYIQLNSYENRVFDIYLEPGYSDSDEFNGRLITKFYRPLRWSKEALDEEHSFLQELVEAGVPVISPLMLGGTKETVALHGGIYFCIFKKGLGRIPQEMTKEQLKRVGRALARIHNVGAQKQAHHRPYLTADEYGWPILEILSKWVAPEVWPRYEKACMKILDYLDENLNPSEYIRIHGDCHKGNLLLTDYGGEADGKLNEFFLVDFDDFCMGPPVQDFWMLFSEEEAPEEMGAIISGYDELRKFDHKQIKLVPALRALRIIHYAGWIARRWEDPTFPQLFPQFTEYTYWASEVEALEKIAWSL